jgi:hypothetical protein
VLSEVLLLADAYTGLLRKGAPEYFNPRLDTCTSESRNKEKQGVRRGAKQEWVLRATKCKED